MITELFEKTIELAKTISKEWKFQWFFPFLYIVLFTECGLYLQSGRGLVEISLTDVNLHSISGLGGVCLVVSFILLHVLFPPTYVLFNEGRHFLMRHVNSIFHLENQQESSHGNRYRSFLSLYELKDYIKHSKDRYACKVYDEELMVERDRLVLQRQSRAFLLGIFLLFILEIWFSKSNSSSQLLIDWFYAFASSFSPDLGLSKSIFNWFFGLALFVIVYFNWSADWYKHRVYDSYLVEKYKLYKVEKEKAKSYLNNYG